MNHNEPPNPPIPGQKWEKLPWKDIFTLWTRGEMDHSKAIDQLLLWGEDTHQLARVCSETQDVIVEEQRALAQDHEILLQKYEALVEEQVALRMHFEEEKKAFNARIQVLERLHRVR